MLRLHISVAGDIDCCLCATDMLETQQHLFINRTWIVEVQEAMSRWSGIPIPTKNVNEYNVCARLRADNGDNFKELAETICDALNYYA